MSKRTPSIAIIVEAYGEWGDSDREVVKRIKRANIAIDHDTAQAVAIEREAIAALAEVKGQELGRESHRLRDYGHPSDSWAPVAHASEVLRNLAQAIRSGEHVKP